MRKLYVLLALLFLCSQVTFAQPDLVVTQIASVSNAVSITGAGDGSKRLFIVDESGIIRIFDQTSNTLLGTNFLDITGPVLFSGEQGLLGLAFHPDFETNGYFYVNYIADPSGDTRISRFTATSPASNNAVNPATELVLLTIDQPAGFTNHKGGCMHFGPDGYLYIAVGDGGSAGDPGNRAQNPQELLGKMLRIDVDNPSGGNNYGIPASNPFVGTQTPTDFRDEIWALGLRNPWRFSFDRLTGDMYIADVGQGAWEEVDFQPAGVGGRNYGWRCYEGNHNFNTTGCLPMSSYTGPVFEYDHGANGGQSITGGFVYRGSTAAALTGWYVCTDYVSGNFWLLKYNGTTWVVDPQPDVPTGNITSFGEDDNGELFAVRLSGPIYQVTSSPLPLELLTFKGEVKEGRVQLKWLTATERNSDHFAIERKTANGDFKVIGQVDAVGESTTQQRYTFEDLLPVPGENIYRLKMVDRDSRFDYSPAVSIQMQEPSGWQLSPNPATGKVMLLMDLEGEAPSLRLTVTNVQGREVLAFDENNPVFPYTKEINIAQLPAGVYMCRLDLGTTSEFRRLVVQ